MFQAGSMSSGQSQPPAVSDAVAADSQQPIPSSPRSYSHVILPSPSSTVQKAKQQNEGTNWKFT